MKSKWFWIFLIICIVEELTFFCPFLSFFLLAAAFSPKIALRFAEIFVEYHNQTRGTNLSIRSDVGEKLAEGLEEFADKLENGDPIEVTQVRRVEDE